jgi:hypothetical protein
MAAHASVERELTSMWTEACADHEHSPRQRWRLAATNATARRVATDVVDAACELTGSSVASRPARLSRCLRAAYTLRGHISTNGDVLERGAGQLRAPGARHVGVTRRRAPSGVAASAGDVLRSTP